MIKPEIVKRVKRANYTSSPYNCYICGKPFKSSDCPHNFQQILWAIEEVQKQELFHV